MYRNMEVPKVLKTIRPKGNGMAKITNCALFDMNEQTTEQVEPGQNVKFIMQVEFNRVIPQPIIGLTVRDRLGNEILSINSVIWKKQLGAASGYKEYKLEFKIPQLNKGEYTISPAVANGYQEDHVQLCWLDDAWISCK